MKAIQQAFGELVVKNYNCQLLIREGYIDFNGKKYPINFIGTEANSDNTWMWGWNNINNFEKRIIRVAEGVNRYGMSKILIL